jgi:hypothetical protein
MPQIQRNSGLTANDLVTNTKLHNLVDTAVITKELITAQTEMTTSEPASFILTHSVANDALRKITVDNLFSNIPFPIEVGPTTPDAEAENVFKGLATFKVYKEPDGGGAATWIDSLELYPDPLGTESTGHYWSFHSSVNFYGGVVMSGERVQILSSWDFELYTEDTAPEGYSAGSSRTTIGTGIGVPSIIDFTDSTEVTFKESIRLENTVVLLGAKPEDPEDEVTVNLANVNKGVYDLNYEAVPQYSWSFSTDVRRAAVDVPTVGKLTIDDTYVVPENEIWVVKYDGYVDDNTDDPFTVVWLLDDAVSKTYQFADDSVDGAYIGHFFRLTGGEDGTTYTVKVRMAVNSGTGGDSFTIFANNPTNPQSGIQCQEAVKTITKIRV